MNEQIDPNKVIAVYSELLKNANHKIVLLEAMINQRNEEGNSPEINKEPLKK